MSNLSPPSLRLASRLALAAALLPPAALAQAQAYPGQGYQPQPPGYGQSAPPPGYEGRPGYDGQRYDDQDYEQDGSSQGYGQDRPPAGYAGGPQPPDYGEVPPQAAYNQAPLPPQGYDGTRPPPPPPGYRPDPDAARQQVQDQQYAAYAQQWAQAYCVKAHGDTGAGAVIGGVAGALLGSTLGGHGAGAVGGAIVGAAGGAAIASDSGSDATSPGCPSGYVVRGGAPAFAYAGYGGEPYRYAAPDWYRPWVLYGGAWTYRPYPYHVWYYGHYYRPGFYGRGYYGGGYHGRGYGHRGRHW